MSKATEKRDAQERAREAAKAFRRMLPNLNGYARAMTGNRKIVIQAAQDTNGGTDGKTIYMRPPIKLGDKTPHDRNLCDKIGEDKLQLCPACLIREDVLAVIYHEIAHIAYDSFSPVSATDAATFTKRAAEELGTKYAKGVVERVEKMSHHNKLDYMRMAMELSPFLHMILNCLEDARINARMGEARPGVRRMMQGQLGRVMSEGIEVPDGRGGVRQEHWRDRPSNAQVTIGLFFKSSRYDYSSWLSDEVVAVLDDKVLADLCDQVYTAKGPSQTYALALKALARLRELGYCRSDKDPEDEDEADENETGSPETAEASEDDAPSEADSDSGSDSPAAPDHQERSVDAEESADSAGDDGSSGDAEARGEGDRSDSDDSSEADSSSEDSPDAGDSGEEVLPSDDEGGLDADEGEAREEDSRGGEDGAEGEPGSDPDNAQSDEGDRLGSDSGSADEEVDSDGADQAGAGPDDAGERDSEGVDDGNEQGESAGGSSGQEESESGSGDGAGGMGDDSDLGTPEPGDDGSSSDAPGDESGTSGSGSAGSVGGDGGTGASHGERPHDSAEEEAVEPNLGTGDIHDFIDDLAKVLGHAEGYETGPSGHMEEIHHDDETSVEQKAIEVAVVQAEYFDEFSAGVSGVNIHERGRDEGDAWRYANDPAYRKHFGGDDCKPSESILGPALLRMRVTFSENKRAHETNNLKSGKVNARSLGKRAWGNDERLFKRKVRPNKRDYSVLIGMDISGSTMGSDILATEKKAVMAQAELLHRTGVRFAVWAHTGSWPTDGSGFALEMYCIKDFREPWTNKTRANLEDVVPVHANLDGHTLEFYRKQLDKETTTDRVIMYYTDGQMPLENKVEELPLLQKEIQTCKNKGYTVLGVGIRNDDPVKHGLDTVRVDSEMDVVKVIRHLEKRLER